MNFQSDGGKDSFLFIDGEVDCNNSVFVGLMDLLAKATGFQRLNGLYYCALELRIQELPVDA
jgi:hypothetical protein